jgi:hypothetical protein
MSKQETTYQRLPVLMKLLSLASLVVLAACTTVTNNSGAGSEPSGTPRSGTASPADSTPAAIVTMRVSTGAPPTSQPGETSTAVAQPTTIAPSLPPGNGTTITPPAPTVAPTGQELSVLLSDDGKTVHLKVGQRFLLNLGADYDWTPIVADQKVVSRVVGILVIRGAQGVYEAHAAGTTILTASGDPICLKSKPACAMPSRLFKVTLVVEP